ncbi:PREDICTED: YLP motif-containing protein 1 isoform X2 [Lupinus angustifolius]|uniref:YLP motif-containing protein 1 isoform X2 n=1 Tax=Lupinus angustifolius TaxID=3871 RepID=UPI00092FC8AE|nr:PREDICTED: YLP motif-containing protein 1 isoform X2 [Lupinus angustifolius]
MDHNHNHHNHHHHPYHGEWRHPRPSQFQFHDLCPSCSFSHFPFCPPPPLPPPQPPQPPPPPPPPYYHHHPPLSPHPYPLTNPNYPNLAASDGGRNSNKRLRIAEEEEEEENERRRLKLIRDHGVAVPNLNSPYQYLPSRPSNGFHSNLDPSSSFFITSPPLPSQPQPQPPPPPPPSHSSQFKSSSLFQLPPTSSPLPPPPPPPSSYSQSRTYFHANPSPPSQFHTHNQHFQQQHSKHHYSPDAPQSFSLNKVPPQKPRFMDASQLFRHPHRTSRPDHFVIILRGLPGSGKSYLAKMLRDIEVENGVDAPRIHSLDDYFMTEVEKVDENDASKSSKSGRNKKPATKKVMEYCYEPEMEEAYRSSMLKSFKKTVEEGVFTFIIVDDRNLRVADFAQFWATAKRSGYEVYILEATYKDPVGCAARNVHGFTQEDIEKMAGQWEEAPSLYLQLDAKSLFHGDDLKESRIQEVDMDMEDDLDDALPAVEGREAEKVVYPPIRVDASSVKDDAEGEHPTEARELGKSKWSDDFSEYDTDQTEGMKGNINALSGLIHHYGKERKSVHWGDEAGHTGFSIVAARKVNALSLVIGPGAGYNLKSNPLPEEESSRRNSVEPRRHSVFQEQIRAEHESFKAVFDKRRQRIGGLDVEEE